MVNHFCLHHSNEPQSTNNNYPILFFALPFQKFVHFLNFIIVFTLFRNKLSCEILAIQSNEWKLPCTIVSMNAANFQVVVFFLYRKFNAQIYSKISDAIVFIGNVYRCSRKYLISSKQIPSRCIEMFEKRCALCLHLTVESYVFGAIICGRGCCIRFTYSN